MAIPGYRILRKISQGGMSTVYLAIQKSVEREVAIKVMSPSLSRDPSFGSRFYREAKIVGQLSHPNIVSIYDVGSYKHYNYIAMDYLPGAPLQNRLEDVIAPREAIRIIREMAAALDYAHERGYVHRDIKPDNILFREDGSAVLCDFGIAKTLKANIKMTDVGSVLGTPHYMSPEQAQGKEINGRADIYSLGVVFFEMLSGQVPFSGDDAVAVAVKHMTSPIPKLPSAQKAFQPIIEKMMAKKAGDRFQTGKEVIAALDELEAAISQPGAANLTQTGSSTTVQVIGLAAALFGTLATAISMSFKRLMLTNIKFKTSTVQLTNKQLEDIDTFILADENEDGNYDDLPLIQDTIEQPAVRPNFRRLVWMFLLFIAVALGAWYFWQKPVAEYQQLPLAAAAQPEQETATPTTESNSTTATPENAAEPVVEEALAAEPEPPQEYRLEIKTRPKSATVRILNIKPRYKPGMLLPPGSYNIAVSARDYFPSGRWVRIVDKDVVETVTLEPTRRLLAAGTELSDNLTTGGKGPEMIVIPKGKIKVGTKQRELSLTKAIAISKYEISFDDYSKFTQATDRKLPDDFGWGTGKRPVTDVSYNDARAYTQWLSAQTGQNYRLPSREEWEYAARGGTTEALWWQTDDASNRANCRRGCDSEYSKLFGSSTAPVGSYAPNPYGLYDTAGNVEEWLQECVNWQDDAETVCISARVAGGSHADRESDIHANSVKSANATVGSKTIGFRVLLDL